MIVDKNKITRVLMLLRQMNEEERLHVFKEFCTICGADNPTCQCWANIKRD